MPRTTQCRGHRYLTPLNAEGGFNATDHARKCHDRLDKLDGILGTTSEKLAKMLQKVHSDVIGS